MARTRRMIIEGLAYHVIARFVDREWFITTEEERALYVRLLGRAVQLSDWRCLAYAVMSNHVHLSLIAGRDRLDSWIRRVHSPFADFMNSSHGRIGPMFVRGPKSRPVPSEGVGNVIAYIHNNPVRAGVVATAAESSWTSHRAYVGLDAAPDWLSVTEGMALAGFTTGAAFDHWTADPARDDDDRFSADLVDQDAPPRGGAGARRRRPQPPEAGEIVRLAADVLQLPLAQLRSSRRGPPERFARRVAIRCATAFGITGVEIAAALGITQQGASVIARRGDDSEEIERIAGEVMSRLCPKKLCK